MHKSKMYVCFAFFPDGVVKKWKYVRNLKSFSEFLTKDHSSWQYFNVYDKGTRAYLRRFYPGNTVPKILGLALLLLTLKFTFGKTFSYSSNRITTTFSNTTFINGIYISATISTWPKKKGGAI